MKRAIAAFASLLLLTGAASAAESMKVTGEVVDTYCYATMGAKGEGHRKCGMECAKKGIPVGLLEKGTDKLYVLLPKKDNMSLPKEVVEKMAKQVTVTGKVYTSGGSQFLTVESIK
jgi:type 1 fimbria pilin